jgi:hypothetical protein
MLDFSANVAYEAAYNGCLSSALKAKREENVLAAAVAFSAAAAAAASSEAASEIVTDVDDDVNAFSVEGVIEEYRAADGVLD